MKLIKHTMDIDPNISIHEIFKTLDFFAARFISLNEQPNLPLPSITIESITVFPSHVWHKVDKVKKGTRYSLVFWFKGNQFV